MASEKLNILFADDDADDCMFFKEALKELSIDASITFVKNGVELMEYLKKNASNLPHVLFLDLNMPLKPGFDCLCEIRETESLKELPIIIYSTSAITEVMDLLYANGAHYYIRKPADFSHLKSVIQKAISLCTPNRIQQPEKEEFVIQP
ncbi:MAG: response regulator [Marinoscillum sp.]